MDLTTKLNRLAVGSQPRPQKTYIITYQDRMLVMRSGKSVWRAINHAKCALWQEFSEELWEARQKLYNQGGYTRQSMKVAQDEIKNNLLKLVEIKELS